MTLVPRYEIGPIRPPSEARSLLVRVTRNCPWNRCRFCTVYKGSRFSRRKVEEVLDDIDAMAHVAERLESASHELGYGGRIVQPVLEKLDEEGISTDLSYQVALFLADGAHSVFLQDANSLLVANGELIPILERLYERFPQLDKVTSYARSKTLGRKGSEKLKELREAGLTRVHVGMESGSAAVLKRIDKGATPEDHIRGGRAAVDAGLELSEYVMPGLGGRKASYEHAVETARVLNEIRPHFIRLRTFCPLHGSGLREDAEAGRFDVMNPVEIVGEIRTFVEHLDLPGGRLVSDHDYNLLMEVEGDFPDEKPDMLETLDRFLALDEQEQFLFATGRRMGYFHALDDLKYSPNRTLVERFARNM